MLTNKTQINCWKIKDKIYERKHVNIYTVDPIINDDMTDDIKNEITSKKWVLKYFNNNPEEVMIIESFKLYETEFCIPMPLTKRHRCGLYKGKYWYIMEKYESSLAHNIKFAKENINVLVLNILNFLEWLHIEKKCVHGDIKENNILINKENNKNPFCITDYETIGKIETFPCYENLPYGYYYYTYGCDYDKPYYSYRADLQAFGYILLSLLNSTTEFKIYNWQKVAITRYENNCKINYFEELEAIKQLEMLEVKIPDVLTKYFDIISNVNWDDKYKNPEIYVKLKNLIF
jgi:serine/threonine protein kinase